MSNGRWPGFTRVVALNRRRWVRVLAERREPILRKRGGRRSREKELAYSTRFATMAARGMVGWSGFPSRRAQEVGGRRDELIGLEPRRANPGDAEVDRG